MGFGRFVGRAILVALDALAAGTFAGLLAFLAAPFVLVGDRFVLAVIVGGVATGVALAVALALAGRGRRPFPAVRAVRATYDRLPPWWP